MRKSPVPKKLKPSDLPQLRKDKKRLGSNRAVAEEWHVSTTTVYYALHPKKHKERLKQELAFKHNNPERTRLYARKGNRVYKAKHPERVMLNTARHSAKNHGLPFNLVESDIHIPERCPILGITLKVHKGKVGNNSPTIDKVIPSRGYVRGNINVISHRANTLKNSETNPSVFDALATYLRRNNEHK